MLIRLWMSRTAYCVWAVTCLSVDCLMLTKKVSFPGTMKMSPSCGGHRPFAWYCLHRPFISAAVWPKPCVRINLIFFFNRHFEEVIKQCAFIKRQQAGRWIHDEMIEAYINMFKAGHAFCIEVEINAQVVGGLYGVKTQHVYCGESMFSNNTNGSKFAMVGLCAYLNSQHIQYLDCQIYNTHLAAMGAHLIPRNTFIRALTTNHFSET